MVLGAFATYGSGGVAGGHRTAPGLESLRLLTATANAAGYRQHLKKLGVSMDDEPRRPADRRFGAAAGTLSGTNLHRPAATLRVGGSQGNEGV